MLTVEYKNEKNLRHDIDKLCFDFLILILLSTRLLMNLGIVSDASDVVIKFTLVAEAGVAKFAWRNICTVSPRRENPS